MPPRRLYTRKSPQNRDGNIIRNQIDFILINKIFSTTVKRVCTHPGTDVSSDHVFLMASCKLKLARPQKISPVRQLDMDKLKNKLLQKDLRDEMNDRLRGYYKNTPKKKWMTEEILQLMDERRQYKNINLEEYRRINARFRTEIMCGDRMQRN